MASQIRYLGWILQVIPSNSSIIHLVRNITKRIVIVLVIAQNSTCTAPSVQYSNILSVTRYSTSNTGTLVDIPKIGTHTEIQKICTAQRYSTHHAHMGDQITKNKNSNNSYIIPKLIWAL